MESALFRRLSLLLLVVGVTVLFLRMIHGFLMPLLLAALFSALLFPIYQRFEVLFRGRRSLAAATCTVLFCVVVLVPVLGFLGLVATQAVQVSARVAPWVEGQLHEPSRLLGRLSEWPLLDRLEPYHDQILEHLGKIVASLGQYLFQGLSSTTRGTVNFLFQFFLFLYAVYFFLKDGEGYLRHVLYVMPLTHEQEMRMLDKFTSVTKATLKGTLLIGVLQGTLAGAALGIAGIQGWVFWSAVMILLSVIPGLGVALVWAPAALYLLLADHLVAAILVAVWCALVVGSIDNVLRPRLVGRDTRMPDLLILFSTLGGLMMFGLAGFLVGPIVAGAFLTLWDIYGVVYAEALPSVGSLHRSKDA